ncbi:hypothetical protein J4450_05000 [Candidatus Micrarchaeota archaeon]|nr:hypothetical protein [Candidatus Micrarchaeota archaeon]
METLLVRLSGATEKVLLKLVKDGYFATKSEAIRAGLLELGKEYLEINKAKYHRLQLEKAFAKKKLTAAQIQKALDELEV